MTLIDWLNTNDGHTLLIALVGLINAITLYITFLLHEGHVRIQRQLNGHLDAHQAELAPSEKATPPGSSGPATPQ